MAAHSGTARSLITLAAVVALAGSCASGLAVAGRDGDKPRVAAAGPGPQPASLSFDGGDLRVAESCDDLLSWYVERGVDLVGAYGWESPYYYGLDDGMMFDAAAAPHASGSTVRGSAAETQRATNSETGTNVQEAGVDEPDVVKTDGSLLVRLQDFELTTYDVSGDEVDRLGSVYLPQLADGEILLDGDMVVAVGRDAANEGPGEEPSTRMLTIDVSDPADPTITETFVYNTTLVAARQQGSAIRLVLESGLPQLDFVEPSGWRSENSAREHNQDVVRDSTIEDWLPGVTNAESTEQLLGCGDVAIPRDEAGLGTLATVAFDAAHADTWSVTGLAADTDLAYFSPDHMYLATAPYSNVMPCCWEGDVGPMSTSTSQDTGSSHLYDFALDGLHTTYVASGDVDGRIADRWAMDEYDGVLRVAVGPTERTGNFNSVVTLERDGNDLVEIGRVDKLGVNEGIRSMRWFDGLAIMVTFQQVDPLYAVDLTDPAEPRLLGKLKIPGYSEYRHPLGSLRLIGIGQGPGEHGRWGAQVGLFDVSDLTAPRRIDVLAYAGGSIAAAATDPRQFTWLPKIRTALTVITRGNVGQTGSVSVLTLADGQMTSRMVEVEYGIEVADVRLVPLPDGRVILTTGDGVSFFPI